MTAITVNFNSVLEISEEQFYQLCVHNPEIKFERNVAGEIVVMPPTGGETGRRNAKLIARFIIWNEQTKLGEVFDSSTGYRLPNGANRSPDVSWIERQRWDSLTSEQKEKFIPLAPDFVLELLSPTDYLANTQEKMREYIKSGVRLGWLINPRAKRVEIYRFGQDVKLLDSPQSISDDEILPGFTLDLTNIF
ncbi:MAG: Uma2 family endonuclease [Cyanobacteria bacterium P01_C01_bin.72]